MKKEIQPIQKQKYSSEQINKWDYLDDYVTIYPNSIVKNLLVVFDVPKEQEHLYPWKNGEVCLYIGQITNMHGHGIFISKDGLTRFGYDLDNFKVIPKDEL